MKIYIVVHSELPYEYEDSCYRYTNVFVGSSEEKAKEFIEAYVRNAGEKEDRNQRAYLTRYYPEKAEAMVANLVKEAEKKARQSLDIEIQTLDEMEF
jgi:hypothetical protein